MKPNVFITARERGKLVRRIETHNTWTNYGREVMRKNISAASFDPDVAALANVGPKYLAFGIGGKGQSGSLLPAVEAAYPAGFDPYGTDGRQYDHKFPYYPGPITMLERPVRLTGGASPYFSPFGIGDVWRTDPTDPNFFLLPEQYGVSLNFSWSGSTTITYGTFTEIPLSEAAVVPSDALGDTAYQPIIAYLSFDTLLLTPSMEMEVTWKVGF